MTKIKKIPVYFNRKQLQNRGWSSSNIDTLLGEHDELICKKPSWYINTVIFIEKTIGVTKAKTVIRTIKLPLFPNELQKIKLDKTLNICRELYNACIQERRDAYRKQGIKINKYDQCKELKGFNKIWEEYGAVDSQIVRNIPVKAEKTFQNFFRYITKNKGKGGYPRFKGKDRYDSFSIPHPDSWNISKNKLYVKPPRD